MGLGGFVGFGLAGSSKEKSLENSCAPNCSDSELDPMRRAYRIGDLSLGIGVAALAGTAVAYVTRPAGKRETVGTLVPLLGPNVVGMGLRVTSF